MPNVTLRNGTVIPVNESAGRIEAMLQHAIMEAPHEMIELTLNSGNPANAPRVLARASDVVLVIDE